MAVGLVNVRRPSRAMVCVSIGAAAFAFGTASLVAQAPVPQVGERPLGRGVPVYLPALEAPERRETPPVENPTGTVSLRDAVVLALMQNPGLAAFAWETRAREARVLQAGRLPNPALGLQLEDFGARPLAGGGINEPVQGQATIQLSQLIELGGKRAARQELAARDQELAAWDYETARIDVLTAVSQAVTDVLVAQEAVALTARTTHVVEQVQQSVGARVEAGVVSPIEETRATVALASAQVDAAQAHRALEASRVRLALLWGSETALFTEVAGELRAEPPPLPALTQLIARLEQSPDLARWAAEISQREAALAVQRSKGVPDVTVTAGYRRFTAVDSNAIVVGASIPLPWFDRNRDGIEEARTRLAKGHEERRAVHARVVAALAQAYAAVASAHDEQAILRTTALPGSQQAFDAVTEGYRLGRFGLLDVLDAQRTLMSTGRQYLRALSSYHTAVADVERLIGAPLTDGSGPSPESRR